MGKLQNFRKVSKCWGDFVGPSLCDTSIDNDVYIQSADEEIFFIIQHNKYLNNRNQKDEET